MFIPNLAQISHPLRPLQRKSIIYSQSIIYASKNNSPRKSTIKFAEQCSRRKLSAINNTEISDSLFERQYPLTPSPQTPTFDHIVTKIFSKSLTASLTSKDAVLKGVRDCILTNNESRL